MPSLVMINRPGRLPKRKIMAEFGFSSVELGGDDLVSAEICHCRRHKIAQYGVDERSKRSQQAAAEEDSNHAAARRFGLGKLVSRHLLRPLPQEPLRIRIATSLPGSSRTHFHVTLHLAQPHRLEQVQAMSNDDRQIHGDFIPSRRMSGKILDQRLTRQGDNFRFQRRGRG